jgi:sugar/nucleoside kinase (ribokinase family)
MSGITVIGSSSIDLTCYSEKLPKIGETVLGDDFKQTFGGKGANQAIAASKLGAQVVIEYFTISGHEAGQLKKELCRSSGRRSIRKDDNFKF